MKFDSALLAVVVAICLMASPLQMVDATAQDGQEISLRVINLPDDRMPLPEAAAARAGNSDGVDSMVPGVIPLPDGVRIGVGERVQVNYLDGVVVHVQTLAGCTVSHSAGNPYKSNGMARAAHSFGLSSGCPSREYVTGRLWGHVNFFWGYRLQYSHTVIVVPGNTYFWSSLEVV